MLFILVAFAVILWLLGTFPMPPAFNGLSCAHGAEWLSRCPPENFLPHADWAGLHLNVR